jgi:glycosyltransferase involved in cell wall biosynthesis
MSKVSVTIITLNERGNIAECLASVAWADEVIVSDSGSTDGTVDICRSMGAQVHTDDWLGFGAQKNLCASRASNPWVLNIDADERVPPALAAEIREAIDSGDLEGYTMPRRNHFGGRWIKHCGWYPDRNLRLYRKDAGGFSESMVHESVKVDGVTGSLKNPLEHYTYSDVSDYLGRMQRYSTLAAEEMHARGRRAGVLDLLIRPPVTFIKMYILRRGFLEGRLGLVLSTLYASYTAQRVHGAHEARCACYSSHQARQPACRQGAGCRDRGRNDTHARQPRPLRRPLRHAAR